MTNTTGSNIEGYRQKPPFRYHAGAQANRARRVVLSLSHRSWHFRSRSGTLRICRSIALKLESRITAVGQSVFGKSRVHLSTRRRAPGRFTKRDVRLATSASLLLRFARGQGKSCPESAPRRRPLRRRSVVAPQDRRIGATLAANAVKFSDEILAGDASLNESAQAFAGVFIDDRDDLDRPPVDGGVELEVHCPHPVGRVRAHPLWCCRSAWRLRRRRCGTRSPSSHQSRWIFL